MKMVRGWFEVDLLIYRRYAVVPPPQYKRISVYSPVKNEEWNIIRIFGNTIKTIMNY